MPSFSLAHACSRYNKFAFDKHFSLIVISYLYKLLYLLIHKLWRKWTVVNATAEVCIAAIINSAVQ
jgi:hypothetical protein